MKTIKKSNYSILEIKKSKFICSIFPISSKNEIARNMDEIQSKNKDARHIVYAYLFENREKYSDAGEPKGTAGLPILSLIKQMNLINIQVIIVRYFGGIKLGASKLVKAYRESFKSAIEDSNVIEYVPLFKKEYLIGVNKISKFVNFIENKNIGNYIIENNRITIRTDNDKHKMINQYIKINKL